MAREGASTVERPERRQPQHRAFPIVPMDNRPAPGRAQRLKQARPLPSGIKILDSAFSFGLQGGHCKATEISRLFSRFHFKDSKGASDHSGRPFSCRIAGEVHSPTARVTWCLASQNSEMVS